MTVEKILKQADLWLGKNERDSTFKEIIDVYNSHLPLARGYKVKYTDDWCATFISALSIKCGMTSIIPTECGCEKMIELFQKLGVWIEEESITPLAGDIIFYDWNDNGAGDAKGWADHVGLVRKVSGDIITVIEGNFSCMVAKRNIKVNSRNIRGYARPKYSVSRETLKSNEEVAAEVLKGLWGNGVERKERLTKAGYNYNVIQSLVNGNTPTKKSNTEIAREVLKGLWGNGVERKERLTKAGYDYAEIQKIINNKLY